MAEGEQGWIHSFNLFFEVDSVTAVLQHFQSHTKKLKETVHLEPPLFGLEFILIHDILNVIPFFQNDLLNFRFIIIFVQICIPNITNTIYCR